MCIMKEEKQVTKYPGFLDSRVASKEASYNRAEQVHALWCTFWDEVVRRGHSVCFHFSILSWALQIINLQAKHEFFRMLLGVSVCKSFIALPFPKPNYIVKNILSIGKG
ncbi:hypothetical protein IE077_002486 [Cardiosporidium cionae]|uniref:Uncharacterized protein n=1 Tax=Cardiosporidium cionae TaxID=476202 RepID=A0ABQ7JAR0_9APIC|nr:hypothetical protein IE077_002486 [Cardiosporidium cionae]|eukprot:KAF8821087.1 hypothetical protein IE077_002486 [Cardiosporidium cionae]